MLLWWRVSRNWCSSFICWMYVYKLIMEYLHCLYKQLTRKLIFCGYACSPKLLNCFCCRWQSCACQSNFSKRTNHNYHEQKPETKSKRQIKSEGRRIKTKSKLVKLIINRSDWQSNKKIDCVINSNLVIVAMWNADNLSQSHEQIVY